MKIKHHQKNLQLSFLEIHFQIISFFPKFLPTKNAKLSFTQIRMINVKMTDCFIALRSQKGVRIKKVNEKSK